MVKKYIFNSLFLVLLALPLSVVAEGDNSPGFIDDVWQIYGSPYDQSEPAPVPGQYFSLHYEQKSGALVLVDLPSVEQGIPILMASYMGIKDPANQIGPGIPGLENTFLLDTIEFDGDIAQEKGIVRYRLRVDCFSETEALVTAGYFVPIIDGLPPAWWIKKVFKHEDQKEAVARTAN